MCGILGLILQDHFLDAAPEICEGLSLLQHRGQDAAGVITCGPKGRFYQCKANGMVRDIFDATSISRLIGGMGVGHGMSLQFSSCTGSSIGSHLCSALSYCWQLQQLRGTTVLRELTLWHLFRSCKSFIGFDIFFPYLTVVEWKPHQHSRPYAFHGS